LARKDKALARALKVNKTLTEIDLRGNDIKKEGAKALAEALKVNSTVTNINLEKNQIGTEGAKAFAEALKVNKTLVNIGLDYSIDEVERLLAERQQPQAETASYVGNRRDQEIGRHPFEMPIRFQALAGALIFNSTVTNINLKNNDIDTEGAKALAEALKVNRTLTNINLHSNDIGNEGAKALAEALKANSTVTYIGLYGNKIGNEGAKALRKLEKEKKQMGFNFKVDV